MEVWKNQCHFFFRFPSQQFELAPLTRARSKSKMVWETYVQKFAERGWDHAPTVADFKEKFLIPPILAKWIFESPSFQIIFPETRILSKENGLLAVLYRCNKAAEFSTLSDVFGPHKNTMSSNFCKYLDAAIIFFKKTIAIPTRSQCERAKKILERGGYPNPEAVLLGDCIDHGVWTTNDAFLTHKATCSSRHAARVSITFFSWTSIFFCGLAL